MDHTTCYVLIITHFPIRHFYKEFRIFKNSSKIKDRKYHYNKRLLSEVGRALGRLKFIPAFGEATTTHRQGGHLDQIFTRNLKVVGAAASEGYQDDISDHKCLKVILKLEDLLPPV